MSEASNIWVVYEWLVGEDRMMRVRSVRGGPEAVFTAATEAGAFAAHEDSEQAWDDALVKQLLDDGVLLAEPVATQGDTSHGMLMKVTSPRKYTGFFGLNDAGEPATPFGFYADKVLRNISEARNATYP